MLEHNEFSIVGKVVNIFSIVGKVINNENNRGIGGLRVEAWDKDIFFDDSLGSAITDLEGSFRIDFTAEQFQGWFLDREPDIYFIILRDDAHIWNTKGSILWNAKQNTNVIIELDYETSSGSTEKMLVKGDVLWADGDPCSNVSVLVYENNLSTTPLLGETTTNEDGHYQVVYTEEQCSRAKKKAFNLHVLVRDENNPELAISSIIYHALQSKL